VKRILLWTRRDRHGLAGSAPNWIKSSLSFSSGNCVEVADMPGGSIGLRNSRHTNGPVLEFTAGEWQAFLAGARNGDFDRLGGSKSLHMP
jgi:hypothetical protein